jgi:hypothetical protein
VLVIVCDITNRVCAGKVRNRAVSSEVGRLFAVQAAVGAFIAVPDIVFHLAFCL